MLTITSNHETEAQIAETLAAKGNDPILATTSEQPATETKTEAGGESAVTNAVAAPVPETETSQVTQTQETTQEKPAEAQPSRGKFKSKLVHEQERAARLADDLELERRRNAEFQARLAELEAKQKPVEKEPEALVKPARPKRADVEFDEDRYELAMDKYETDLAVFNDKMAEKRVADAISARDAEQQQARQKEETARQNVEFGERVQKISGAYEDWTEVFDALGDSGIAHTTDAMDSAVLLSENPGDLLYFMARDVLENDGKEIKRISKLLPVAQVAAIARLETRLVKEREDRAKPPAVVAATPEKTVTPEVPVKQKTQAAPVKAPIAPVGSRGGHTPSLADADGKGVRAYAALRSQGVNTPPGQVGR